MAQELTLKSLPDNLEEKFPAKIEVKREVDGEEKTFSLPLKRSVYVKGPFKGYPYLHPDASKDTIESLMEAFGEDFVIDLLQKACQSMGRAALEFASEGHREVKKDADGTKVGVISFVDLPKLLQALATGEYRGENIKELQEKVENLQAEVSKLSKDLVKVNPANGQRYADMNVGISLQKLSERIAKINEQISNKRRKPKSDMEEDEGETEPTPVPA